ncbi:hypothetical protein Ahy_B03g064166 [Arachis hypogaea]|uniref:Uncharacterized protein n=1 Tax=Arachis hypogaea TaxID=3818 RepID=A0A444ZYU4_ARAHY|nr:hypothetical protein Ahy_B03g064166 [Arachis hypogaea]
MMGDIYERRNYLTIWLRPDPKKTLYVYWKTNEGFKYCRLTNRTNRASARSSKYIGGLATFMKTKTRLSKLLSRDATMTETFKYTHTLEENKKRFANHPNHNMYYNFAVGEADPDTVWRETTYEPYKNRVFELGSFFTDNQRTFTLRHSSSSTTSRPVDPADGIYLREQVLELT